MFIIISNFDGFVTKTTHKEIAYDYAKSDDFWVIDIGDIWNPDQIRWLQDDGSSEIIPDEK